VPTNRLDITGHLVEIGGLRHTPSGLPSLQLRLGHVSEQIEAGHTRKVECEIDALAFGEVATALARSRSGAVLRLTGFLDRRSVRNPQPILHVTGYELIKE
jgi:primosomal replication protein N